MIQTIIVVSVLAIAGLVFVLVGIEAKNQEHLARIAHEVYRARNALDIHLRVTNEKTESIARIEANVGEFMRVERSRRPAEYRG